MERDDLISVVVPVYNAERYLEPCLNSILSQTYKNLEILCVNDGSTDGSPEILKRIAAADPRVIVLDQENTGVSTARNRGIDAAHGEWITFVDSDDALDEKMYRTLYDNAVKEQADISHCGYRRFDPDGSVKDVSGTGEYFVQSSEEALRCLLTGKKFVASLWNKLYKMELFQQIRLVPDIRFNEDVLANMELFLKAEKTVFHDLPLYLYYNRPGSATSTGKRLKKSRDCRIAAERIWALLEQTDLRKLAAKNLYRTYISEYRALVFLGIGQTAKERAALLESINRIKPDCGTFSKKQRLNYFLLRYMPHFYKRAYKVYDSIRVPNWDVN